MGSGSNPHADLARPVGRLVAELGCHLLTGGGGGVMAEAARAFCEVETRQGLSIGIIRSGDFPDLDPSTLTRAYRPHAVNPYVEIPVHTHLPLSGASGMDFMSRNHINVLTSDAVVALPGGPGTYSEVVLRLQYGRPIVLFLGTETIDGRKAEAFAESTLHPETIHIARSVGQLRGLVRRAVS